MEQTDLMAMARGGNGNAFGELRKVALPDSGPIERALIAAVAERFLVLHGLKPPLERYPAPGGCRRGLKTLVRRGLA